MARATSAIDAAFAKAAKGERVILRHGGRLFELVAIDTDEEVDREVDADLLAVALAAEAEAAEKGEEPVPWEQADARLARLP